MADIELLRLVAFSFAGIGTAGLFALLPNAGIATITTCCFYVQIFAGFRPGDFALLFCSAATTALIINNRPNVKGAECYAGQKSWILLVSALAAVFIIFFRHNIAEFVIFFKTSGLLLATILILAINVLTSSTTILKACISLAIGLSAAILGPGLAIELPFSPWNTINLNEGKNLVAVLTGACIFPAILSTNTAVHVPLLRARSKLKSLEFPAILFLIVTGIGISPLSIVLLAILNSENVNFGAMTTYESSDITLSIIFSTIIALAITVLLSQKYLSLKIYFQTIQKKNNIEWIYVSIIFVIFSSATIYSDLGIEIIYFAIFIGMFLTMIKKHNYPINLFLVGFIYGNRMENMLSIISKSGFSLPIKYISVFSVLLVSALFYRIFVRKINTTGSTFIKNKFL